MTQPPERNWLAMVGHLLSPLGSVSVPGCGQCGDLDGAGGRPWQGFQGATGATDMVGNGGEIIGCHGVSSLRSSKHTKRRTRSSGETIR